MRWRLKAEQALMFDKAGQTQLRKLVANVHQRERSWTIVGDEGDLDRATNNVEVRGNVVVTSNDGLRLETAVLRWEAETQAPVDGRAGDADAQRLDRAGQRARRADGRRGHDDRGARCGPRSRSAGGDEARAGRAAVVALVAG